MAEFEFVLQTACLKVLGKALHAMGKQTTQVHMLVSKDELMLRGRNKEKTAFLEFAFKRSFFNSYCVSGAVEGGRNVDKCVSMKYLMKFFKSLGDLEKVRLCTLSFETEDADKLVIVAEFSSWTREMAFPFVDERRLARFEQFITWTASGQDVILKNYNGSAQSRGVKTETKIKRDEFMNYNVDAGSLQVGITFSVASLRKFMQFGEAKLIRFVSDPGDADKPLLWTLDVDTSCFTARLFTAPVETRIADDSASVVRQASSAVAAPLRAASEASSAASVSASDSSRTLVPPRPGPPHSQRPTPIAPISQFSAPMSSPVQAPATATTSSSPPPSPPPPSSPEPPSDVCDVPQYVSDAVDDVEPRSKRLRIVSDVRDDDRSPRAMLFRQLALLKKCEKNIDRAPQAAALKSWAMVWPPEEPDASQVVPVPVPREQVSGSSANGASREEAS